MALNKNLPIKFFQKREKDESGTEGSGSGVMPKWINRDNVKGKSIYFRQVLSSVEPLIDEKVRQNNYIPTVMRLKINEDALAKRFRKEIASIFNVDKKMNLISVLDSELLLKIDNSIDLRKMIINLSKADQRILSDSIIMGIDAIENMEIYSPLIDVDFSNDSKIKVKLFNYGDNELNRILINSFETFCFANNVLAKSTFYSADLNIYSITGVTEDALTRLKEFDGIQLITDMPSYDITFDEVSGDESIEIKSPVLVAQLLKYTKKKLHKNYRFCIFNHARKKEFHASIIRFG